MNTPLIKLLIIPILIFIHACNSPGGHENTVISIKTTAGDIKIKLYDGTPLHRDNFIKLLNTGFYDNITFHRVIRDFMIQTGDPSTRPSSAKSLPDSVMTFTIPAEFNTSYFHKKGAVAAAREGNEINPEMRSSGTQFYIVQGTRLNDDELDQAEIRINGNLKQGLFNKIIKHTSDSLLSAGKSAADSEIQAIASIKMFDLLSSFTDYKIPEDQRNIYKSIGGVPRLDGTYTVFGEVIEGLDVVDRIAAVSTDGSDRPLSDVRILKIKILKN